MTTEEKLSTNNKLTIREWLEKKEGTEPYGDFLINICGYTLDESFEQVLIDDSYFTRIATKRGMTGNLPKQFQEMVNNTRSMSTHNNKQQNKYISRNILQILF